MEADTQTLDWEALDRPAETPPWEALEALSAAIVAEPSLWRRAAERYRDPAAVDGEDYSYIAVPTVLAMAGRQLSDEWRRPIGRFLIDRLNQTDEDSDYERELLVEMAGRLGPTILPELWQVVAASTPEDTGWFHLWGVADLALETDDPALRAASAAAMRGVLQRMIDGEIDRAGTGIVASILADLRDDQAEPLVKTCLEQVAQSPKTFADRMDANELRHALKRFEEPPEAPQPQPWAKPLRESVDGAWTAALKWYRQPDEPVEPIEPAPAADSGFTPGVRAQKQEPKIGRNEPCPCGSGKKYKKCCLNK